LERVFESEPVSEANFDELSYLLANPDVAEAVTRRKLKSGRQHFERWGRHEGRRQIKPQVAPFINYESRPPSADNALDLFDGRWASNIPGHGRGTANLFEDDRIHWFRQAFGDVAGRRILELGPLEGGHTYMLARDGAQVTAVEANTGAFLRCLVIKEILDIRATFLLGDFVPFIAGTAEHFDAVIACGVLYHMERPLDLLDHITRIADAILIWTHVFEDEPLRARKLRHKFADTPKIETRGSLAIELWEQHYLDALNWSHFCGGQGRTSVWLTKRGLCDVLTHHGFDVTIGREDRDHPNGPAMLLLARRVSS